MPLTDTRLRNLRPTGERQELPDRDGLHLRVSQRGVMTWALRYRVAAAGEGAGTRKARLAGPKGRVTLGEYPTMGLLDARAKALALRRLARAGVDPAEAEKPAPPAAPAPTVADLIERYATEHLQRRGVSWGYAEKVLRRHVLPAWGLKEVTAVRRGDLVRLMEAVRTPAPVPVKGRGTKTYKAPRGGPGAAIEVRKWARAMFQFALDAELVETNPFAGVRNRDRIKPRTRVLSMEELRRVWAAAGTLPHPWGPYFRLLALTGCRRGEWAGARREWLTEGGARLEIPAESYKTGKPQVVPLSAQAREVLAGLTDGAEGAPFVLSTTAGAIPVSGFAKAKRLIDAALAADRGAAMAPWVAHDLRRSMATHMERLGVEPHVIEVCLGHVLKGIAATYRHYSYLKEKEGALQRWADELAHTQSGSQQLPDH